MEALQCLLKCKIYSKTHDDVRMISIYIYVISIKYIAKLMIMMKNSHHTNHKERAIEVELSKFLLLIGTNKSRE